MVEAAVCLPEGQEVFCQRVTVFYKAAVIEVHSQLAQGNDDLRDRFNIGCTPRSIAALAVLIFGKPC